MARTPFKIIQISDTHLFAQQEKILLGVKTYESFAAIAKLLQQAKDNMDIIVHSGDLSQDYSKASYLYIAELLKDLNVPVYCIAGNHDDPKMMAQVYPRDKMLNAKHLLQENWQFIFLNTHKRGAVEGLLEQSELAHLNYCLQAYPEHHTTIILHHQPVKIDCLWLDRIGLTNADAFWEIVTKYANVRAVLFGHIHQEYADTVHGIACYGTPSTCIQFKPKQNKFGLDNQPPAYRWLHFYPDGRIETAIVRAEKYIGVFEEQAKGY